MELPTRSGRSAEDSPRATRASIVAVAVLVAVASVGTLAVAVGGATAGAALAGAVCGGAIGAWAAARLSPPQKEDDIAYTVVTHERPGWHSVDLRDDRAMQ